MQISCSLGGNGPKQWFSQKTAFLRETNLGGSGTQIFKGIANFNMCFEKYRISASKWAMGKASGFNIVRLAATWIFFREGHEKLPKRAIFGFWENYLRFLSCKKIQGSTMLKLTSRRFRKSGTYWVWEGLNGSYCCSKLADCEILGPLQKIRGVTKKQHSVNNEFGDPKWIAGHLIHVLMPCYSFQVQKLIIYRVFFFCDASYFL